MGLSFLCLERNQMEKQRVKIEDVGVPNRKGFIYSEKVITDALEKYGANKDRVVFGHMKNECDLAKAPSISFENMSHMLKNFAVENKELKADLDVLHTRQGIILREAIKNHHVYFVMRGVTILDNRNGKLVKEFKIICIDAIIDVPVHELKEEEKLTWTKYLFSIKDTGWRSVSFPPPGPYWLLPTGDGKTNIMIYLPENIPLRDYWPEADVIESIEGVEIEFTEQYPRPSWWKE